MEKPLALAAFLLSLLGCEPQRSVFEHHAVRDGRALLHARASLEAGVAQFECVASATGLCYWTLRPARCAGAAGACPPTARFALAVDDRRQVTGLGATRLCVGERAGTPGRCHVLGDAAR